MAALAVAPIFHSVQEQTLNLPIVTVMPCLQPRLEIHMGRSFMEPLRFHKHWEVVTGYLKDAANVGKFEDGATSLARIHSKLHWFSRVQTTALLETLRVLVIRFILIFQHRASMSLLIACRILVRRENQMKLTVLSLVVGG